MPVFAATVGAVAFAVSWGVFWSGGTFLDREAVAFMFQLVHPVRMLRTVNPWLSVGVPAAAAGATVVVAAGVGWALRRTAERCVRRAAVTGLVAAGATAAYAAVANLGGHPAAPSPAAGGELLTIAGVDREQAWHVLRYKCGPCATVLLDLTGLDARFTAAPRARSGIVVEHRPRTTMDDYLAGVDRRRLRPWNVLVVEVESLRADALRAYGGRREVMPVVDTLAAESVCFADAHTQATHSNYAVP